VTRVNLTDPRELASLLEAFLLASGKPQSLERLFELFEEGERPEPEQFKAALELLGQSCAGRAFELKEVASGYRLQVRERFAPWVGRLWEERPQRYSRALLETLALIATTKAFLDHFNLKNLDELPPLAALRELEPEPLLALDDDLPVPGDLQARADATELVAEARQETSFHSLLAELDSMELGLKTDFDDLLQAPAEEEAEPQAESEPRGEG